MVLQLVPSVRLHCVTSDTVIFVSHLRKLRFWKKRGAQKSPLPQQKVLEPAFQLVQWVEVWFHKVAASLHGKSVAI